jgi:hypothetical protein
VRWNGRDGERFHYTTQDSMQFEIYELFTSGLLSFNIFRSSHKGGLLLCVCVEGERERERERE